MGGSVHANKDMNKKAVTDAVTYITDQEEKEGFDLSGFTRADSVFRATESKYKPKREAVLKQFQKATHTQYDPSSSSPYIFGEASEQEVQKFNKAVGEYQKDIIPVLTGEMNEKLGWLAKQNEDLTARYTTTEAKIAATNYADDAEEPSNRIQLFKAHLKILQKVGTNLDTYEEVLRQYGTTYMAIMKIDSVTK
jgi:hypothetical protein